MRSASVTAHYGTIQGTYWAGYCMVVVFASAYLLDVGLANAHIGLVIALASALSAVAQPIFAALADKSRLALRWWAALSLFAVALIAGVLLLPLSMLLAGVVFGLGILAVQLVQPLVNALGLAAVARGVPVNFGVARACGSIASAIVSVVAGAWVATSGRVVIPMLVIGLQLACAVAVVYFLPAEAKATADVSHAAPAAAADEPLTRQRWLRFVVVLAALTCLMTTHNLIATFVLQIVTPLGGGPEALGAAIMIAALAEVPPMLAWSWIVRRWGPGVLLVFAGVMYTVRSVLTLLAGSVPDFYAAQILQMLSFSVLTLAGVYYAERLLPARDRARGQAYMTMTASAGTVLGALLGGVLLDAVGVPGLLVAAIVTAAVGTGLMAVGVERGLSRSR